MEGVGFDDAAEFRARVLEDDLDDFAELAGEGLCLGVPAPVGLGGFPVGEGGVAVLVDVDEQGAGIGVFGPGKVSQLPDDLAGGVFLLLLGVDDDAAGDFRGGRGFVLLGEEGGEGVFHPVGGISWQVENLIGWGCGDGHGLVVPDHAVASVGLGTLEGLELEVKGGFVPVFLKLVDGLGLEEDVEALSGSYIEAVGLDGDVVLAAVDLDDREVVVVLEAHGKKRKAVGADEAEAVGLARLDVNDGEGTAGGDFDLSLVGVITASIIRLGVTALAVALAIIMTAVVTEVATETIRTTTEATTEETSASAGRANGGLLAGGNALSIEKNAVDFTSPFERAFSNIAHHLLI